MWALSWCNYPNHIDSLRFYILIKIGKNYSDHMFVDESHSNLTLAWLAVF